MALAEPSHVRSVDGAPGWIGRARGLPSHGVARIVPARAAPTGNPNRAIRLLRASVRADPVERPTRARRSAADGGSCGARSFRRRQSNRIHRAADPVRHSREIPAQPERARFLPELWVDLAGKARSALPHAPPPSMRSARMHIVLYDRQSSHAGDGLSRTPAPDAPTGSHREA